MKIFSKVLLISLFISLSGSLTLLARDRQEKCHCVNLCNVVGSYIGVATVKDVSQPETHPIEAQFHEDGTATILLFDGDGIRQFVGAWKCVKQNCFKFCTINTLNSSNITFHFDGEICFVDNCFYPSGSATFTTIIPNTPRQETSFTIDLQRVSCPS